MKLTKCTAAISAGLLIAALSSNASAAIISFTTSVGTQPGNVGTVTITDVNSTTVNVLVDLLPTYGFMNSGGPHTPFAFTLNGETGVTAAFVTPVGGSYPPSTFSFSLTDAGNTPYGTYGIGINSNAGNGSGNAYYGDLSFNVSRASGLTVNDFIANSMGYYFSADLTNGNNTGAQAWNTPVITKIPEPATLALLGLGLMGIGAARRRRTS